MSLLDAAGVVTGDIWCSGAFTFESPLKDLLDSGEYTLEQLLAEDELLQELRGVHPQLIDFFSSEEVVTGLVQYVTLPVNGSPPPTSDSAFKSESNSIATEPLDDEPEDQNEAQPATQEAPDGGEEAQQSDQINGEKAQDEKDAIYIRYPYMSCEVICCEIKGIVDLLVDGFVPESTTDEEPKEQKPAPESNGEQEKNDSRRPILDLLFAMLYEAKAGEIDDYRAGYFDKILSVLFRKRPQTLADYINNGGGRGSEVLMKAMFKHLYSHSIMQIVQRLLLPQPPLPPREEGEEEKEGDDLYSDPLESGDIDGFGSFRCSWSESDVALGLLLDCLIENTPHSDIEQEEERRLSLYQNASEVLITIIQNSPLTSPTLHTLTTNPVLEKLIMAATSLSQAGSFSPHDSQLTCTMNVLESLILQLGGYGSVGTMMYPEDQEDLEGDQVENGEGGASGQFDSTKQELATADMLISQLPVMLSNLSELLTYPGAETWSSPMQFSKDEPQKILGSSRLRIVRLLESLVLLGDPSVDSELCKSNCLEICLDLFWKFQWCSMLHQSVANLLVHVFEGANARAELQSYFLVKCNLLGRLMDSFWEDPGDVTEAVMAMKVEDKGPSMQPSSVDAESGGSVERGDTVPVSDDDVALLGGDKIEEGEPAQEPENDASPPQSFRLGYMGHVIIICQALVHACSNEIGDPSLGGTNSEMNGDQGEYMSEPQESPDEGPAEEGKLNSALESVPTDDMPENPLILAQLVETHPLQTRWDDFVQSTLASETAIQSTPLGGFPGVSPGMDPLHAHRPGLAEDDDYEDDDGAAPPLPPRGLLVGGDVIDMDDNDLDVAASMMAGLSMGRGSPGNQDLLSGIPQQPGDGSQPGGYMFDDPLGDGRFGNFDDDDSSSDEESELSGNTGDSGGAVLEGVSGVADTGTEAPVMDLFAGNFDAFGEQRDENGDQQGGDWSDFANFDNAFDSSAPSEDPFKAGPSNGNIDEIFGDAKDHAELLEATDPAIVEDSQDPVASNDETADPVEDEAAEAS